MFGLASYSAEQKTREIGIRKIMGASVPGLVSMFSRQFLTLGSGGQRDCLARGFRTDERLAQKLRLSGAASV